MIAGMTSGILAGSSCERHIAQGKVFRQAESCTDATDQEAEDHAVRAGAKQPHAPWRFHSVEALPDYCLRVVSNDGVTGIVRMKRLIHSRSAGVFAVLSNPARFAEVRLELGAVSWPGEIDLAPDAMHAAIISSGEWVP